MILFLLSGIFFGFFCGGWFFLFGRVFLYKEGVFFIGCVFGRGVFFLECVNGLCCT